MEKNYPLTEAIYYILLAVKHPNHGYGIIQDIEKMTNGRLVLGPGSLYGAVNTLLEKRWIKMFSEDKSSRKKKEYVITDEGKKAFNEEVVRLNELLENSKIMEEK